METVLLLLFCLSNGVLGFKKSINRVYVTFTSNSSLLFLLGLPNTFGSERVMGGSQAVAGEFPYVVSISRVDGQHICGGFIYSPKWIVTAASCVYG